MIPLRDSARVLDRDFLEARSKILELAAILDRIDRAPAPIESQPDSRLAKLRQALEALTHPEPDRAEMIQRIFSLEYDPAWRERMEVRRNA